MYRTPATVRASRCLADPVPGRAQDLSQGVPSVSPEPQGRSPRLNLRRPSQPSMRSSQHRRRKLKQRSPRANRWPPQRAPSMHSVQPHSACRNPCPRSGIPIPPAGRCEAIAPLVRTPRPPEPSKRRTEPPWACKGWRARRRGSLAPASRRTSHQSASSLVRRRARMLEARTATAGNHRPESNMMFAHRVPAAQHTPKSCEFFRPSARARDPRRNLRLPST